MPAADEPTIGERIGWHRRRRGLSRRALAELVGRSEEWLRLLETEDRGAERLSNLVEIARVLRLEDLTALTGQRFSAAPLATPEHPAVPLVRRALSCTLLAAPVPARMRTCCELQQRIDRAWAAWSASRRQYTALGTVLPDLLADAITTARLADIEHARRAHAILARVYHLAQRFAFCVRAVDLAATCADQALLASHTADDQVLVAMSGWTAAMTALAADRPGEAAELALAAAAALGRRSGPDAAAVRGSLLLFAAVGTACSASHAQAWRLWDAAADIATGLASGYHHPQTTFGQANVAVYGVALEVETGNAAAALRRAALFDPAGIPSTNRRAQHHLDVARGHHQRRQYDEVLPSLLDSLAASEETIRHSRQARALVTEMIRSRPRPDSTLTRLASHLGVL